MNINKADITACGGEIVCVITQILVFFLFIDVIGKYDLTVINRFHSHLEGLWSINDRNIRDQVSTSALS